MLRLWFPALTGLTFIATGAVLSDLRLAIVGLIILLLVIPMAIQFAVMKCLGSKTATINLLCARFVFNDTGFTMLRKDKQTDEDSYTDDNPDVFIPIADYRWCDITQIDKFRRFRVLTISGAEKINVFIPEAVIPSDLKDFIDRLAVSLDTVA